MDIFFKKINLRIHSIINGFFLIGFVLIVFLSFSTLFFQHWIIPFTWSKAIVFRVIISFLVFIFLYNFFFRSEKRKEVFLKIRSLSILFVILISFLFFSFLSLLYSFDVQFSLWGDPLRSGGFINFFCYILFTFIAFFALKENQWKKVWSAVIIAGIFISFIAIFQNFGFLENYITPQHFRPSSTLGNPIFLAIYLIPLIFLSLSFGIFSEKKRSRIFYFLSCLLFIFVVVFISQTRSAVLGLIIGFITFLFLYPVRGKKKITFIAFSLIIILIITFILLWLSNSFFNSDFDIIKSGIQRVLSLIFDSSSIIESRLSAWKVSLKAIKDRPILGYGPENFEIAFNKYYDPLFPGIAPTYYSQEGGAQWWDRAHNLFLDIVITLGIPALILYISFFCVLLFYLQRVKTNNKEKKDLILINGIQASFLGYLTAVFFNFDTFDIYIIIFLLIGYSFFIIYKNKENINLSFITSEISNIKNFLIFICNFLYKFSFFY